MFSLNNGKVQRKIRLRFRSNIKEPLLDIKISAAIFSKKKKAFQQDAYRPLQWPSEGVSAWGGGSLLRGVCPSACWDTPHPVDRMTDACENITLPQLCCRR